MSETYSVTPPLRKVKMTAPYKNSARGGQR